MPSEGAAARKKAPKPATTAAAAAAPEPDLTKEEAVEELAQALLREFMHKKGAKAALTIFDDENARTDKTIKSRAVMTSLMAMQAIQARNAKAAAPHSTFMEQLCGYRLRKRRIAKGDTEAAQDDSSGAEDGPSATKVALAESKTRIAQLRAALDAAKADREEAIAAAVAKQASAAEPAATSGDGEAPKKEKKAKKAKKGDAAAADVDDDKKKKQKKAAKKAAAGGKAFDPLGLGGGGGGSGAAVAEDDGLLSAGRSGASSGSFGGPVGHSWNPAGAGLNIPEVGIGGHHAAAPAPAAAGEGGDKDAPPPSAVKFLAGNGMNLMATKVRAVAERDQMHFDDSPAKGRRRSSLDAVGSGLASDAPSPTWEYDYPSPEGGRKQYDPRASGSGVLKKEEKKPRSERRVVIMAAEETE